LLYLPLSNIEEDVSCSETPKVPIESLTETSFLTAQYPPILRSQLQLSSLAVHPNDTTAPQTILNSRDKSETTQNRPAMADGHETEDWKMSHVRLETGAGGRSREDITTPS
jgi:hypothetical protein